MGEKSIERALEVKLKGNELFKKNDFESAISLYTEAIALCPQGKTSDLSIMYQNRAAALERLGRLEEGLKDCGESLRLNNRYGKSYDRRKLVQFGHIFRCNPGPLKVDIEGETIELHVVALSEKGKNFITDDRSLKLNWGGEIRGFLAKEATDEMPYDNYYNITLLGKELSFDVDLSTVGCSCNSALFFVSLPGHNPDGSVARGNENPYYCDANKMGGVWCWEHDVIESNKYNLATTPHTCNAAPENYIDNCDRRGCQVLAYDVNPRGMCPGDDCLIDTRRPFRIHQKYVADNAGMLVRISNDIKQDGNVFSWDSCSDAGYLRELTGAFQTHMAMTFQLWGEDEETMQFLDEKTGCSGVCVAENTQTTFSNIAIRTLGTRDNGILVV